MSHATATPPPESILARETISLPDAPGFIGVPSPFGMVRYECDRCHVHLFAYPDASAGRCDNCGSFGLTPVRC